MIICCIAPSSPPTPPPFLRCVADHSGEGQVGLHKPVYIRHLGSGAGSDPTPAACLKNLRTPALLFGHGADHGDLPPHTHVGPHPSLERVHTGQLVQDSRHASHAFQTLELGPEVVHVEPSLRDAPRSALIHVLQLLLRLLHKGDDIAHADNSGCNALRPESLKIFNTLADACEPDRLAGRSPHGQRRAAAPGHRRAG